MASGMGVLPGRERQASVQQALQGLCPSLQAEFPGGGGILPALSFPPLQKVQKLVFKMGPKVACGSFFVWGQYDFLCGAAKRFYIGKTPDFYPLASKMRAPSPDVCPVAALHFFLLGYDISFAYSF